MTKDNIVTGRMAPPFYEYREGQKRRLVRQADAIPILLKAMQAFRRGDQAEFNYLEQLAAMAYWFGAENERAGYIKHRRGRKEGQKGCYIPDDKAVEYARSLKGKRGAAMAAAKFAYPDATPDELRAHEKRIRRRLANLQLDI
jgi:hypothetical protein